MLQTHKTIAALPRRAEAHSRRVQGTAEAHSLFLTGDGRSALPTLKPRDGRSALSVFVLPSNTTSAGPHSDMLLGRCHTLLGEHVTWETLNGRVSMPPENMVPVLVPNKGPQKYKSLSTHCGCSRFCIFGGPFFGPKI